MAKPKRGSSTGGDGGWSASQVVAHNLTQARELRGMTQTEVAERLSQFTGTAWTATTVAQAEGSVTGNRVRQFTANELVALARTFDLPVLYFFLPPEDKAGTLRIARRRRARDAVGVPAAPGVGPYGELPRGRRSGGSLGPCLDGARPR